MSKRARFDQLIKLVKTEEQAALLYCLMFIGDGKKDILDEIRYEISEYYDEDEEDIEEQISCGIEYLETIATEAVDDMLRTDSISK